MFGHACMHNLSWIPFSEVRLPSHYHLKTFSNGSRNVLGIFFLKNNLISSSTHHNVHVFLDRRCSVIQGVSKYHTNCNQTQPGLPSHIQSLTLGRASRKWSTITCILDWKYFGTPGRIKTFSVCSIGQAFWPSNGATLSFDSSGSMASWENDRRMGGEKNFKYESLLKVHLC